jgi:cytochrome c556
MLNATGGLSMRISNFSGVLALLFLLPAFAQDQMPAASGSAMDKPMPENVDDTRQIVPLNAAETAMVAAQMRQMLASVQGIADGLARNDMKAVAEAASSSGPSMMKGLPVQIRKKFPESFAQMGMATHKAFEQIAHEASMKDPGPVLEQLSAAMQNCLACHATYRFAPPN